MFRKGLLHLFPIWKHWQYWKNAAFTLFSKWDKSIGFLNLFPFHSMALIQFKQYIWEHSSFAFQYFSCRYSNSNLQNFFKSKIWNEIPAYISKCYRLTHLGIICSYFCFKQTALYLVQALTMYTICQLCNHERRHAWSFNTWQFWL